MNRLGLHRHTTRLGVLAFALALALFAGYAVYATVHNAPPLPERHPLTAKQRAVLALYRLQHTNWQRLADEHEKKATAYWARVNDKRIARREKRARGGTIVLADYVLEQPPVYSGPQRPAAPPFLTKPQGRTASRKPDVTERDGVPVVADFLRTASEYFQFKPDRPTSEIEYKRVYVRAAHMAGISREQVVRIFAFEAGGNGRHDVQAGLEYSGKGRAITTALGYNQLLATNTVGLLAEHGDDFVDTLSKMADAATPERRKRLQEKIRAMRAMIAFARTFPNQWAEHDKVARTPKGYALHAVILDIDIGPILQTRKLTNSMEFARKKGINAPLSAAELEMMNLMGDGSGLDILLLTREMREKVPTSNFFQRGGYERNPIVSKYNVASALIAVTNTRMDTLAAMPGAKEMGAEFDALAAAAKSGNGKAISGGNSNATGQ